MVRPQGPTARRRGAGGAVTPWHGPCLWPTLLLFGLLSAGMASADAPRSQAIKIDSDRWELDQRQGTARYSGSVTVTHAGLRLDAEVVTAFQDNAGLDRIVAEGEPVRVEYQGASGTLLTGRCERLTYRVGEARLLFEGRVHVRRAGDQLQADTLRYDLATETAQAEGGPTEGRVRMIIEVPSRGSRPNSEEEDDE